MIQIENYPIVNVGKSINLSDQIFGDFKVIYRTTNSTSNGQASWLCQCQLCKKYTIKTSTSLKTGKNLCSCRNDLTGKKIGRWTIEYQLKERTKKRGLIYHCKCECGNEKNVPAESLRRGESQSCGCLQKEKAAKTCQANRIDLTGQHFGKLTALYPIYSGQKNKHTNWICSCECGNIISIDMGNLRSGKSLSCGCTSSYNEENIIKLLTQKNILFSYQHRFQDLATLEYDFYVNNSYIIEYDGEQHFHSMGSGWAGPEKYQRTHKSDLLKNKYCFEHNIPLIRIPYDTKYDLQDLNLETTRFLLTPENEQEYYNKRKIVKK